MLNIVTREVSGLLDARPEAPTMDRSAVVGLALHHSGYTADVNRAQNDPVGYWKAVQAYFLDVRAYSDLAYNYMIIADGRVFEGRGLRYRCAANGTNEGNAGYPSVLFPGDFRSGADRLSTAQIGAFRQLRAFVRSVIPQAVDLKPHSHFKPTACPGDSIVALISELMRPAPAPGQPGGRPQLRRGAQGETVKCLQRLINNWGGARLLVDGDFGPATETAVRRFQTALGLVVDGWVGNQTWGALERYGDCERF